MGFYNWLEDLPSSEKEARIWAINDSTSGKPMLRELLISLDIGFKNFHYQSGMKRSVNKATANGWWMFNQMEFIWVDSETQTLTTVEAETAFDQGSQYVAAEHLVPVGFNDLYRTGEECQSIIDAKAAIQKAERLDKIEKVLQIVKQYEVGQVYVRKFTDLQYPGQTFTEFIRVTGVNNEGLYFSIATENCNVFGKYIKRQGFTYIDLANYQLWKKV